MLDKFLELMKDQFVYGGKKYALNDERESTDVLFDVYGKNWLLGTMDKYTFRFKNLARERDLLKIATYCYIVWLKRGFWVMKQGITCPVIDTNLTVKSENFKKFEDLVIKRYAEISGRFEERPLNDLTLIDSISTQLSVWAKDSWQEIDEQTILTTVVRAYFIWKEKFSDRAGQDTDTNNEKTS